ncbi:hypothetical protein LOTGIDRAFT_119331 [Lottia gigantea]|uniref:Arginyl-tRNA--protein transferase 1 n=1 Tax=Lottia gigantea TaxID=225164 RepID=V3ZPB1_LOTGI|nr:hypothetical protein LOTGIDRAFT_119331 [Lottia gigantea]ESO93243.1 hypothetical protein LOTGIDRAFT_119331 [Lottia gigantea]
MAAERSIVEYFSGRESHRCGYCGSPDTNCSHGMWAHTMTVQDYQDLIDRGWRRSGKYCYKPTMNITCCPHYTIKCAALDFRLNKSHKKLIKRVNKYLIYGEHKKEERDDSITSDSKDGVDNMEFRTGKYTPSDITLPDQVSHGESSQPYKPTVLYLIGKGADPNLPSCKKAKQIRLEKKAEKLHSTGDSSKVSCQSNIGHCNFEKFYNISLSNNQMKNTLNVIEFLNEPDTVENPAHKLEIRLVQSTPQSEEFVKTFTESHKVYHTYQMDVHKDPPEKPNPKQYKRFLYGFLSSFKDSHSVFRKYQMSIHNDKESDCTVQSFTGFLVDSPLQHVNENLPMGYGSFHQHYILDGKLIAVGVIDILTSSVSSVYLYYDPEYHFLSLGTYTALREIAFVRELNKYNNNLKYYYMGFYIHSCPKMRYKGQYYPSLLVCPETFQWVPIEICRPKLDKNKYSRLNDSNEEDENSKIDVNKVLVLKNGEAMPYEVYKFLNPRCKDELEVIEYATLTGKTCSERMLLFRK